LRQVVRHIAILCCIINAVPAISQNLIINPSFENFEHCPEILGSFNKDVVSWSTPTKGSTDYFNGCSIEMGTPKNFNGSQPADFGAGYAGLYLYAPDDYREYIQAELTNTLIKGKKYNISFYVSLAERSDFAVKEFGVLFSNEKMYTPIRKELSKMQLYRDKENKYHSIDISDAKFYQDTQDWILVQAQFKAKGTENFMTLGNFKTNSRTRTTKTKRNAKQGAYYYVDMVLLESAETGDFVDEPLKTTADIESGSFELEKIHVFENVLFKFDEFELLPVAKNEIQRLFKVLEKDNSLSIKITGHTDSVGSESYNNNLSQMRAAAVTGYLVGLGLDEHRITCIGLGGNRPIASNASEEGRMQNRRVEFLISRSK